jgi:hypothetical protein
LGQLVLGAGQASLNAFDLAEPALALSFSDPVDQPVADGLGRESEHRTQASPNVVCPKPLIPSFLKRNR